jgi:hypothetical protein
MLTTNPRVQVPGAPRQQFTPQSTVENFARLQQDDDAVRKKNACKSIYVFEFHMSSFFKEKV